MDLKQIHDLIKVVNKSNIGEISIEDKDGKVTIKQKEEKVTVTTAPAQMYTSGPAAPVAQAAPSAPNAAPAAPVASNLITIKSPMIGTFYRSSSPDKPPFAEVGSEIKKGDKICIIEAMKLFNEIESEVSIYQGVTLGGKGFESGKRHPNIKKGASIFAASTVLGDITVGENAIIAAGSLVLNDVIKNSTVAGVPAKIIKG